MCRFLLILCLITSFAFASTFPELSLDELLSRSQIAFYGRVLQTEVIEKDGEPWTQVTFEILEPFRGIEEGASDLSLSFLGGTLSDGRSLIVSLMPQFESEETVLILAYSGDYYSPLVGFNQGLWHESASGFSDERGRILSLSDEGELILGGEGASNEDLFAALKEKLVEQP